MINVLNNLRRLTTFCSTTDTHYISHALAPKNAPDLYMIIIIIILIIIVIKFFTEIWFTKKSFKGWRIIYWILWANSFSRGGIKSNKSRMALENINISWWNIFTVPLNEFFFFICNITLHKQHIFNSS